MNSIYVGVAVVLLLLVTVGLQAQTSKRAEKNIEAGQAFLYKNADKEGVVTLPSGMQYEVLVQGEGDRPSSREKVTTHYHGTLINGKVFDSSVDRGIPATFPVNGVIKGWQEALPLMQVGSKWRLYIPHDLAYGLRNMPNIPAGSVLIFEVELLRIVE